MNVPSARSLDVLDDNFESGEVEGSDGIESDIEKDESPLEEGVDGVGW